VNAEASSRRILDLTPRPPLGAALWAAPQGNQLLSDATAAERGEILLKGAGE